MARDLDDLAIETGRHVRRLTAIDDAASDVQVVRIVREYLGGLSRVEMMGLPEDCWPGRIADANDLAIYASRLARRRVLASESLADRLLVQRLSELLSHCVARMSRLARADARAIASAAD